MAFCKELFISTRFIWIPDYYFEWSYHLNTIHSGPVYGLIFLQIWSDFLKFCTPFENRPGIQILAWKPITFNSTSATLLPEFRSLGPHAVMLPIEPALHYYPYSNYLFSLIFRLVLPGMLCAGDILALARFKSEIQSETTSFLIITADWEKEYRSINAKISIVLLVARHIIM